ncbi:MAG TPA: VOC family protein [Segeticoccus sp.]|uniref:VOC family protein n=1 Tax=Segeticoccus sp. TaxID=2706531 RepID=UPI002D80E541|nr:VOC family protein [Segeticoccus sp.]HET8602011.1 VOC family protein [Segeticoccus sp.]
MPTHDDTWPEGTPCWIDVMVTDVAAAKDFYSGLFGWECQESGPDYGGYVTCLLNGRQVAAISPKPDDNPFPNVWSTYLAVDDLEATAAKVRDEGGSFMMEPMDVGQMGRMAYCADPTGATFGLWQAGEHKGIGLHSEPGALVWEEQMSNDYEAAKTFYARVLGYSYDSMDSGDFLYSTFSTTDGQLRGGIGRLPAGDVQVPAHWAIYFGVSDTDAAAARVSELGGSVQGEPQDSPYGRVARVTGPQGEAFCLISVAWQQDQPTS